LCHAFMFIIILIFTFILTLVFKYPTELK
jgi:hypothetical protein